MVAILMTLVEEPAEILVPAVPSWMAVGGVGLALLWMRVEIPVQELEPRPPLRMSFMAVRMLAMVLWWRRLRVLGLFWVDWVSWLAYCRDSVISICWCLRVEITSKISWWRMGWGHL